MLRYLGIGVNSFPKVRELSQLHSQLITGPRSSTPPGLGNWDNSCYQNSIVHGLAALPALSDYLSRNLHHLAGRSTFRTHRALKNITDSLNDPRNRGCALWIPNELKSMSSWQQQDAQEYFSKIVEEIDRESKQALNGFTRNPGLRLDGPSTLSLGNLDPSSSSESIICSLHNPLEGLLAQRVGCTHCGWCEEISLIPFNCLTVSLGRRPDNDIQQCLDEYTDLERIEGVECAKCTLLTRKDQLRELAQKFNTNSNKKPSPPRAHTADHIALRDAALQKIRAIDELLESGDLSDSALTKKCAIPRSARVQSTKTRQAVIARPPKSLVIHINRSVFDERTGMLVKNSAPLRFPKSMDITEWCLGAQSPNEGNKDEVWTMDPAQSLLPVETLRNTAFGRYELQAVICHFGRHETGHYVCFRKFSTDNFPFDTAEDCENDEKEVDGKKERPTERWYRLSDEKVSSVSEGHVLAQGGAFMLFYEAVHDDTGGNVADLRESVPTTNGHGFIQTPQIPTTSIEASAHSETVTATTNGTL
ncbi:hypothetical protein KEM54_001785 [Ascosphaera aggregata]|nr:hypothetical protein KEM54_001785 [Ascosphaera aggregata]